MERNVWTTASDSWNSCVEVKWVSGCSNGSCVEVSHDGDRVLVRDSKLKDESPILGYSRDEWSALLEELRNDRGPVYLQLPEGVWCWRQDGKRLEFTGNEWLTFLDGVLEGLFDLDEVKT